MSAEILREAAKVLRERAEAANGGPWESVPAGAWTGRIFGMGPDGPGTEMVAKTSTDEPDDHSNAVYIATMHPGVGLALADWLDAETEHVASHLCEAHCEYPDGSPRCRAALSLARLIVGAP